MRRPTEPLPLPEFVAMLALIVSIVALATDIMLPALDRIGADLGVADPNDAQLVISSLFVGFAVGQLLAGPLSDSFGRKPIIYLGYAVFIAGCLISLLTTSFTWMLIGRALQGLGAAGPRIVAVALVRDGYAGRAMARIMSFVMAVFIFVPALAPAIGQVVISFSGWRATFALLLVTAATAFLWFALRQPETLAPAERRALSAASIAQGLAEIARTRLAVGYTIAMGTVFGAFLGYLNAAQQIFQSAYHTGTLFPVYFAGGAFSIGLASVVNARLVMRLGMRYLTWRALAAQTALGLGFLIAVLAFGGIPPIGLFMAWLALTFFCTGILFGNMNAMAMEPLGHMAGLGAAVVGAGATIVSLPLGWWIGASFDGTVTALVAGFAGLGLAGLLIMRWTERTAAPTGGHAGA